MFFFFFSIFKCWHMGWRRRQRAKRSVAACHRLGLHVYPPARLLFPSYPSVFRVSVSRSVAAGVGFWVWWERSFGWEVVLFVGIFQGKQRMEGKKTTGSIADDLVGRKEAASSPKSSSSSSGYFSSVFPPASSVSPSFFLYFWMLWLLQIETS